jgi:hypothetical protein
MITALGAVWIPDGLEITLAGSVADVPTDGIVRWADRTSTRLLFRRPGGSQSCRKPNLPGEPGKPV